MLATGKAISLRRLDTSREQLAQIIVRQAQAGKLYFSDDVLQLQTDRFQASHDGIVRNRGKAQASERAAYHVHCADFVGDGGTAQHAPTSASTIMVPTTRPSIRLMKVSVSPSLTSIFSVQPAPDTS